MTREKLNRILEEHKKWLTNNGGTQANLRRADLQGADLREANLDYSCWPIWCGSLGAKVDKRIAAQIAYHFCRLDCDDPDYINARNALIDFANQFHRVDECGLIEEITVEKEESVKNGTAD